MATAIREKHQAEVQETAIAQEHASRLCVSAMISAGSIQPTSAGPRAARPPSLLTRPGISRQMSSVTNLIDAYSRNSPGTGASAWSAVHSNGPSSGSNSNSAPGSPSATESSYSVRSVYHSQIVARRSSVQVPYSPRASTMELSPRIRERRPSAPEMDSSPTRLVDANAAKVPGTTASIFDIRRLRSKPAPPQQTHSKHYNSSEYGKYMVTPAQVDESGDQHPSTSLGPLASMPNDQQDYTVLPLATKPSVIQLSSQASAAVSPDFPVRSASGRSSTVPLHAGSRAESYVPSENMCEEQQPQSHYDYRKTNDHALEGLVTTHPHLQEPSRNISDHQRHVAGNTGSAPTQQHYLASSFHFDSQTSNSNGIVSQQHMSGSPFTLSSPQTPRKIRNSSLPIGASPSASSSPNGGRQSPSTRRPLRYIATTTASSTTSSPNNHSAAHTRNQPTLLPSASTEASLHEEVYESSAPAVSSLSNRQASPDGLCISSPPPASSELVENPEQALPSIHGSPTKPEKERPSVVASSDAPHRKLTWRNQPDLSNSTLHLRSLSLHKSSSRGSTPNGFTGSGSGSEQDDAPTAASCSRPHLFVHRPAWLDQDPNASVPLIPHSSVSSRAKPIQQYPTLHQQQDNDNNLMSSSHAQYAVSAPSSLPHISAFAAHAEASGTSVPPKRKASFYRRKRSQTASGIQGSQATDSNGFPILSPMSEIVKNMPLHDRMSHGVLHVAPPISKRSTSAGGFLHSITRKLSHPTLREQPPNPEARAMSVDTTHDYFGGASVMPPPVEKANLASHSDIRNLESSPKLGSSCASRSWRHPFQNNDNSKNEAKGLPQVPVYSSSGKPMSSDPFSISSPISLPGFLHRSPRKDSLSSDKSDQFNKHIKGISRSRTISQDGDSSDGHSSEVGITSLRAYNLAPPVPELPLGIRNAAGSLPSASMLTKAGRKTHGLLRSPSLGHLSKQTASVSDSSPKTPRASVLNNANSSNEIPSPIHAGSLLIDRANESLISARRSGLSAALANANAPSDSAAPVMLGSFAAMDKIAAIENDIKEAKFLALMDRSTKAEHGVIKVSLASTAAREAGIV